MIKQIAWNTFKNTGNIDTFLEFKQVEDIENKRRNPYEEFAKLVTEVEHKEVSSRNN